jgi:hypothetical protein
MSQSATIKSYCQHSGCHHRAHLVQAEFKRANDTEIAAAAAY